MVSKHIKLWSLHRTGIRIGQKWQVILVQTYLGIPTRPPRKLQLWNLVSGSELTLSYYYRTLTLRNLWFCSSHWLEIFHQDLHRQLFLWRMHFFFKSKCMFNLSFLFRLGGKYRSATAPLVLCSSKNVPPKVQWSDCLLREVTPMLAPYQFCDATEIVCSVTSFRRIWISKRKFNDLLIPLCVENVIWKFKNSLVSLRIDENLLLSTVCCTSVQGYRKCHDAHVYLCARLATSKYYGKRASTLFPILQNSHYLLSCSPIRYLKFGGIFFSISNIDCPVEHVLFCWSKLPGISHFICEVSWIVCWNSKTFWLRLFSNLFFWVYWACCCHLMIFWNFSKNDILGSARDGRFTRFFLAGTLKFEKVSSVFFFKLVFSKTICWIEVFQFTIKGPLNGDSVSQLVVPYHTA